MMEATTKQISFARNLGIENPQNYTKEALSKMIDEKQGNTNLFKPKNNAAMSPQTATAQVILTRTDKPHSFEFGKATRRHKIYYGTIEELKAQYTALKDNGFIDNEDEIETIKI